MKPPEQATTPFEDHHAQLPGGVILPLGTFLQRGRPAALALALAFVFPVAAGTADAAPKRDHKAKRAKTKPVTPKLAIAKPTPAPAATPAPAVTSVISIGGYVFYNLTYAEAFDAYAAAVAAAPAGYTPPPVTSISVTTTVGGTV